MKKPPSTDPDDLTIPLDLIASAYPAIADKMRNGTPAARNELRRAAHHYQREFIDARRSGGQPAGIASGQHELMDYAMGEMLAKVPPDVTVSCRAGCSACCYQAVHITDQEAQLLTMLIRQEDIPYDYDRAAMQAQWEPLQWKEQAHADRRCGLLAEDGTCSVYEHRPLVCRKLVVSSDRVLCDTRLHPGAAVMMVTSIQAEIITAAAHVATEGGTLPRQMLIARGMA